VRRGGGEGVNRGAEALFTGTYTNKVDAKGRVSVPAEFRNLIAQEDDDSIVCFPALYGNCLEGGGPTLLEHLYDMIEQMNPYADDRVAFEISILADCQRLNFDGEGRVTLTGAFCKYADISDYVTFVGLGDKFQMWNPVLYEEHRLKYRQLASQNRGLLQRHRTPPPRQREE